MRILLSLVLALTISAPVGATGSWDQGTSLIVPSHRIGPAYLGMSQAEIDRVNRNAPCLVVGTYDTSGHAVWLQTNWGGGCLVSDKVQVGLPFGPVLRTFGKPDRMTEDVRYPHATAFWLTYQVRGIAFRVLGWPSGALIQAIAVFPAIAARVSWRTHLGQDSVIPSVKNTEIVTMSDLGSGGFDFDRNEPTDNHSGRGHT